MAALQAAASEEQPEVRAALGEQAGVKVAPVAQEVTAQEEGTAQEEVTTAQEEALEEPADLTAAPVGSAVIAQAEGTGHRGGDDSSRRNRKRHR